MTCNPEIARDVSNLFNSLTGYSSEIEYQKLLVAPGAMRRQILDRIEREIRCHKKDGKGYLAFKMNSLVDKTCITALYKASMAGVKIDLQIRGICCLRPGADRVSENIRVTSIVGRYLEHARIFYFRNGGDEEILLGSADLMPRNLDGRVETLFPVQDPDLRDSLRDDILQIHLSDNIQARLLCSDGSYTRVHAGPDESLVKSQDILMGSAGSWRLED
jgi:polyphosphate kinase